jgi:aminoglycoside phosphotransferase (APT) family kinase protein
VLSSSEVVPYLLDAGVFDSGAVLHERVRVVDASRRNQVFVVTGERSPAYIVKQPRSSDDPAIGREAAVLRALGSLDCRVGLGPLLPVFIAYDAPRQVLVLRTDADGQDLRERHSGGQFALTLARACGRALALLHRLPPEAVGARPAGLDPTWPLSWHCPKLQQLFELSAAGLALLRLTQRSQVLCRSLDDLRESWRPESLIHGDLRWENWITLPEPQSPGRARVLMVDWELAGPGDPRLDVGTFFAEYLAAWVHSIPIVDPRNPDRMLRYAERPLDRMQPAIRQFWAAYQMTSGKHAQERVLAGAVRYAAARLLQAAVEETSTDSELRAHTVCALQLGVNILERPGEAAGRLLGLPVPADTV